MTAAELATRLGDMYHNAPKGEFVVMVHLFGVKHADDIRASGASPADLVKAAQIPDAYGVEINKGMNLAKYVSVR